MLGLGRNKGWISDIPDLNEGFSAPAFKRSSLVDLLIWSKPVKYLGDSASLNILHCGASTTLNSRALRIRRLDKKGPFLKVPVYQKKGPARAGRVKNYIRIGKCIGMRL